MLIARHKQINGCPLAVIDVAGQLKANGKGEYECLNDIIGKCKDFAKRENICLICCVHINRDFKNEPDKKPKIWHLRGSGNWEQDADRIIFIHREAYFGGGSPFTEINQAKDRMHNETRSIHLIWDKTTCQYQTGDQDELTMQG